VRFWSSQFLDFPEKSALESFNKPVAVARVFAIVRPNRVSRGFSDMASSHGDYQPGSMDISQHKKAYEGFLAGSKWTFILVVGIVVFLAIFRTH